MNVKISFVSLVKNCNHKGLGIYYLLSVFLRYRNSGSGHPLALPSRRKASDGTRKTIIKKKVPEIVSARMRLVKSWKPWWWSQLNIEDESVGAHILSGFFFLFLYFTNWRNASMVDQMSSPFHYQEKARQAGEWTQESLHHRPFHRTKRWAGIRVLWCQSQRASAGIQPSCPLTRRGSLDDGAHGRPLVDPQDDDDKEKKERNHIIIEGVTRLSLENPQ